LGDFRISVLELGSFQVFHDVPEGFPVLLVLVWQGTAIIEPCPLFKPVIDGLLQQVESEGERFFENPTTVSAQ
jgi:hypothetical protein